MSFVIRTAFIYLCWGLSLVANAAEIQIGEQQVSIPLPDGFVELTSDMSPYYESLGAYINPGNTRFLTLIKAEDAEAINSGELIELGPYINVETQKSIHNLTVTPAQFETLRSTMRTQIASAYTKAKKAMPSIIADGNSSLSEQFDLEVAVRLGGVVPLPVHFDDETTIAHSILMTVHSSVEGEGVVESVVAATTTVLFVKNKILFLYTYGNETELNWTREASQQWAQSILRVNSTEL